MKIYIVTCNDANGDGHHGKYKYASSKKMAKQWIEKLTEDGYEDATIQRVVNYPISKKGMLNALNHLASHADNG